MNTWEDIAFWEIVLEESKRTRLRHHPTHSRRAGAIPMTNTPIVFLDTETDGVHPGRRPWEIAMIRYDGEVSAPVVISFFVEIDLSTADPSGLGISRFYERHPLGRHLSDTSVRAPRVDGIGYLDTFTAAHAVARWTHGAHIVGAVPNFDTETLAGLLRAHGLTPAWHYHLIDVEALAVGYLHGLAAAGRTPRPGPWDYQLPWRSDDLSRACGVEPASDDERHTAVGDAYWAMRLYDAITGGKIAQLTAPAQSEGS